MDKDKKADQIIERQIETEKYIFIIERETDNY